MSNYLCLNWIEMCTTIKGAVIPLSGWQVTPLCSYIVPLTSFFFYTEFFSFFFLGGGLIIVVGGTLGGGEGGGKFNFRVWEELYENLKTNDKIYPKEELNWGNKFFYPPDLSKTTLLTVPLITINVLVCPDPWVRFFFLNCQSIEVFKH